MAAAERLRQRDFRFQYEVAEFVGSFAPVGEGGDAVEQQDTLVTACQANCPAQAALFHGVVDHHAARLAGDHGLAVEDVLPAVQRDGGEAIPARLAVQRVERQRRAARTPPRREGPGRKADVPEIPDDGRFGRLRGALPRANAVKYVRDKFGVNLLTCICAIDKATLPTALEYWTPGVEVGGVHELLANALIVKGEKERTTDLRGQALRPKEEPVHA